MKKAVTLARVSTKEQEEHGHSLDAQTASLRKYAEARGFEIAKEFTFSESAGSKIRKKFEEVIAHIRKHKIQVLLCENVDRATRNFKDAVDLDEMRKNEDLEIHFVKDGFFINKDATGNQMFMWEAKVFLAKQYLNRLSDDVKRSVEKKVLNGEFPGWAPVGYLNIDLEDGSKSIIPDPDRGIMITRLFELYSTGQYSGKTLKIESDKMGLISRGNKKTAGKKLNPSTIHRMLRNPFYAGTMVVNGQEVLHNYQPLVSREVFDKCQAVIDGYHKKPFKAGAKPFMLRGMIRCKKCGCLITPEIKKGKYTYYSCSNYKGLCERAWIPEADLLEPIYKDLQGLEMPADKIDELTLELKKIAESESGFYKHSVGALQTEHQLLKDRLDKMYEDKLDGRITQDEYDEKLKSYKARQADLLEEIGKHDKADEEFYLTANMVANLASNAKEIFESSEPLEKRQLLGLLLQNCELDGKKLLYELRSPFDDLIQVANISSGSRDGIDLELLKRLSSLDWKAIASELQGLKPILERFGEARLRTA